jgi:hypothetical protein
VIHSSGYLLPGWQDSGYMRQISGGGTRKHFLRPSNQSTNKWRRYEKAFSASVESIEGIVELDIRQSFRTNQQQFVVTIGSMEFKVGTDVFLAFKNREPYRIYYAPGSNTILSAEWLRNE